MKDEITTHIQDNIIRCMLFADGIILEDETSKEVNQKLEFRRTLESKVFELSTSKTN